MDAPPRPGSLPVIERLPITAPLGLRFRDSVTGAVVSDGLIVTAWSRRNPARRMTATTSLSGIYSFRRLPDLLEVENGSGDDAFWRNPPVSRQFVIEVVDLADRFQPFRFEVTAPTRGVYTGEDLMLDSSPIDSTGPSGIPLFSAPTRSVPSSMAVIRGELREPPAAPGQRGAPAAWAVVEAEFGERRLARSFADEQGRVALIFPYPELETNPLTTGNGSPSGSGPALREQRWNVILRAAYGQLRPTSPVAGAPALVDWEDLFSQPAAILWSDTALRRPLTEAKLAFGQESLVQTRDFTSDPIDGAALSELFITTAV